MIATAHSGWLNNLSSVCKHVIGYNSSYIGFLQARNYAARKGTREKARKKKVKVVVEKVGFIPHNLRKENLAKKNQKLLKDIMLDDSKLPEPIDDVWIKEHHKWNIYSFEEAVKNHRETHHPTICNQPNAYIKAFIELDMLGTKKTKFVNSFTQIACLPHAFDHGQNRKILAFCKSLDMQDTAREAGAHFAGGKDLIKRIQNGEFSVKEYDVILSEPTILPDLLLIRGLLRKKFPNTKLGTLSSDIQMLVIKFLNGIRYTAKSNEVQKSYGTIDVIFGTLDMDTKQLEENFASIINDVYNMKPKRPGPFITRTCLTSPPLKEMFKVEFEQYLPKENIIVEEEEEEKTEASDVVIASH